MMAHHVGFGSSDSSNLRNLEAVVQTLNAQGNKYLQEIDSYYDSCISWLDEVYHEAVNIFSGSESPIFLKTPRKKTKKRSRVESDDKENDGNRRSRLRNVNGDISPENRRTTRGSKRSTVNQPNSKIRASSRTTRSKAQLTQDEIMPPPEIITAKAEVCTETATEESPENNVTSSAVKNKIKVFEEKSKTPLTPTKVKEVLNLSSSELKNYVSTLSPVILNDPKLTGSPRVVCTPVKLNFATEEDLSTKTTRRSTRIRKTSTFAKKSLSMTLCLKSHIPPSKRQSSVSLCKIRKSIVEAQHKRSRSFLQESSQVEVAEEVKINEQETESEPPLSVQVATSPITPEHYEVDECDGNESDKPEDVIEKTPSPVQTKTKTTARSRLRSNNNSSRRPLTRACKTNSSSADKHSLRLGVSSAKKGICRTPLSANRSSFNRTPSRFVSPKLFQDALIRQKREEMEKKEEKERETLHRRQEKLKQKVEEQKRKREAKMQRALEKRRLREEQKIRAQEQLEREEATKSASKEPKMKSESQKKNERLKQKAAEERRMQEELARQKKLQEQEEEQMKFQELLKRKKEHEEAKRQEKLAEQRRIQEERNQKREMEKELEKKRIYELEQQRLKEQEEKKKIQLERQKLKEAQRQAEKLLKREEIERIQREKLELERIRERERLAREEEENKNNEDSKLNQMNVTFTNDDSTNTSKAKLNSTFTSESQAPNPECYDITPERRAPIPLKHPDNYDISNLHSDDPTDDESNPKKFVPNWAKGQMLRTAIIFQHTQYRNLNELFPPFEPPNLDLIFKKKRSRFHKRTSSANWSSPVLGHSFSKNYSFHSD